jgi:succinyl-diaminopimelate desuccinylase
MDPQLRERLATITGYLVQFPTVGDWPEEIEHCANWVRTHVLTRASRLHARQFVSRGRPSLLFTAGDAPPRLLLCGHLDVVEAQDQQRDFQARELDEFHLGGRGTADMKGPIAALIDIMETEAQPGLGLLLTTDEESGGEDGVGYFLKQIDWRPEAVVLPDGGANMRLVTNQKGIVRLKITTNGKAAHGSRPWLGVNAIDQLYKGYQALLRAFPAPQQEDDWRVSITLSHLHGGVTLNAVPWYAEAILDIRYPGTDQANGHELIEDIRRRLIRHQVRADVIFQAPPFQLDLTAPAIARLQKVMRDLHQAELPYSREAGASDARYFSAAGIPVLMFQPDCADWHGANERINLTSLASYRSDLAAFTRAILSTRSGNGRMACRPDTEATSIHPSIQQRAAE